MGLLWKAAIYGREKTQLAGINTIKSVGFWGDPGWHGRNQNFIKVLG